MSTSYNRQSMSVAKVMIWMIIFLVLYLPLFLLVLASVIGCIWGLVVSVQAIIDDEVFLGIVGVLSFLIIAILFIIPFSIGILRPFFALYKAGRDERIEITETEAPELVNLIYRIADLTKNKRPKHIYVSAIANACVFFDKKFSNIFIPVRKNIEIGLGVFNHMRVEETVACIAHEFGHFSQDTMRWGTVVSILNTIIASLMSVNERWNSLVNKLINCPWIIGTGIVYSLVIKSLGWILYAITIGYMSAMEAIYKKIQLAYLELSRKMEYKADAVSARIVGSDVYVSFACKLMELSKRETAYFSMIQRMASRNLLVSDFWEAYSKTDQYISELTKSKVYSQTVLTEPLNNIEDPKLIFEAVYSSHPDWKSRIEVVKEANYTKSTEFTGRAWDLIPQSVKDKVAKQTIEDFSGLCDSHNSIKTVSDDELAKIIEHDNYWYQYAPYFQRDIIEFDYNECTPNTSFNLEDKDSLSIINKYQVAKNDYDNAIAIMNNDDFKTAIYQGVVYKTSQLPMDTIEANYEEQWQYALRIDKSICEYAMSRVSDIGFIKEAYRMLFYAQNFLDNFETIVTKQQNETIAILNKSNSNVNSHQFETIKDSLQNLNECLLNYGLLDMLDNDLFEQFAPDIAVECVNKYINECRYMLIGDSIEGETIKLLFQTCDFLRDTHNNILSTAKMTIIDVCVGKIK